MLEKTSLQDDDATRVKSADVDDKKSSGSPSIATQDESTLIISKLAQDKVISAELTIGSVLKDTLEIVEILGEGGMGTVFKVLNRVWEEVEARDPYVAIKVLKPELSANKQLVRSLFSDFDRTKMLANCPNIIKVYGFDRDGQYVYMTMEYLTGKTLADKIVRGQSMPITQAWSIIEGIGNALIYAHENNIVHRDIKPGNVIITDKGVVKVLDFGIASKINESEGDETKFGGHMLGGLTVAYASPEMQRDYPPDARDDIYAFACVIYEILTGQQFYKQKIQKALPIKGLNSRQMEALNKALAFEREQRTASIRELLDKLRPVKKPWAKYIGIGCGIVMLIVAIAWRFHINDDESKQKAEAEKAALELKQKQEILEAKLKAAAVYQSTSSDDIVQLRTSKPNYKNGESFQLTFKLRQPRYVRIVDRDADGQETLLRPNAQQLDELLFADREYIFPPEGVDAPVSGRVGSTSTVTIVTSAKGFPENVKLLNTDGSISEQVRNSDYSWTQIQYTLE